MPNFNPRRRVAETPNSASASEPGLIPCDPCCPPGYTCDVYRISLESTITRCNPNDGAEVELELESGTLVSPTASATGGLPISATEPSIVATDLAHPTDIGYGADGQALPGAGGMGISKPAIVGAAVGVSLFVVLSMGVLMVLWRAHRRRKVVVRVGEKSICDISTSTLVKEDI